MTNIGNSSLDHFDIEHYRNVYKSVHGVNPKVYPEDYSEYEEEIEILTCVVFIQRLFKESSSNSIKI